MLFRSKRKIEETKKKLKGAKAKIEEALNKAAKKNAIALPQKV